MERAARWSSSFCADPGGNAIEVLDFTMEDVVAGAHETFPESDPAGDRTR
jgi:hypothetical protein